MTVDNKEDRLRVVHSESSCGWGGQELRILTEAAGMQDRGHKLRLVCPSHAPIYEQADRFSIATDALPIARRNIKGLWSVMSWLKQHDVDIINTHSSTDSWLFAVAAKLLRKQVRIVRTRHVSAEVDRDLFTRWLYTRGADVVVTTGKKIREMLIETNGFPDSQIVSIPTGIDTNRFARGERNIRRSQLGLPSEKKIIGIVATIRSWKGHRFLVDAFHQLQRDDVHLLIVGDGPIRHVVEQQIRDLNLTQHVTMPGNQEDVVPWLQALDIFAQPSYANEGVPQSILQAMGCCLPVVSTSVGSIQEALIDGETGIIVPAKDRWALTRALDRLLDDTVRREQMGEAGRRRVVAQFGIESMLNRMEQVFQRVA